MTTTACPACGRPLGEQEASCSACGWPHAERAASDRFADDVPAASGPLVQLFIGLAVGLLLGLIGGWMLGHRAQPIPAAATAPDASVTAAPPQRAPVQRPAVQTLRLRELRWKEGAPGLCKGVFEVVAAPESVRVLEFSVMNAEGEVISSDRVSTTRPIRSGTVLELGFEARSCAEIQKWRVQIVE